jgi:hypothetical protein
MTSRLRDRRRATGRMPTILRGPGEATGESERVVQHGAQRWGYAGWRLFSGMIVVVLSALLAVFFVLDIFYVHSIDVVGLRTTSREEIYALTGIADMHIFWVDPAEVRRNILRSPTIADATIEVGWPPVMVQIVIEEREPALIWEQAGVPVWIDVQGRVMSQREQREELVRIVSDERDGPMGPNVQIGLDVVGGALQLKTLYPNIDVLRYDPNNGLGYQDGRGWMVWFGTGTDMPQKIAVYNVLVDNLLARNIRPSLVNVANKNAPYYCCRGGN